MYFLSSKVFVNLSMARYVNKVMTRLKRLSVLAAGQDCQNETQGNIIDIEAFSI